MKVAIQLAQLLRYTKTVVVELPDDYLEKNGGKLQRNNPDWNVDGMILEEIASEVYAEEESDDWEIDAFWGATEGTHNIGLPVNAVFGEPDYRVLEDGTVEKV
jgi:hypothetical protein